MSKKQDNLLELPEKEQERIVLKAAKESNKEQKDLDEQYREDYLKRYVEPHRIKARDVKPEDLPRLLEEAHILFNLCFTKRGHYNHSYAMAHPQIDDKDPLRFFVTYDQQTIINPTIVRHTGSDCDCQSAIFCTHARQTLDGTEGCMSYPDRLMINVPRWNKIEVMYITINDKGEFTTSLLKKLNGIESRYFQHEIDHLNAVFIYDLNTK